MKKYFTLLLTVFLILCLKDLFAAGALPPPGEGPCWPPPCIPIDGGITFLAAAAAAFGAKKLLHFKKTSKVE